MIMLTTNIYQFNFAHYEWACGQNILKRESYTLLVNFQVVVYLVQTPKCIFAHYGEVLDVDHHQKAVIISKQRIKPVPNTCHVFQGQKKPLSLLLAIESSLVLMCGCVEYMSVLSRDEFFLKQ